MEPLEDLRARVAHSERLATAKVRRMAKGKDGYDVTGTDLDPRKPKGWINRATRKSLLKYEAELKYFRRPSVGWVKSANGKPIARQRIKNLEAAARKRNRDVDIIEARIAKIHLPWAGKTVGEVAERRTSSKRRLRENDSSDVRTRIKERWKGTALSSERAAYKYTRKNREMFTERAFHEKESARRGTLLRLVELSPAYDRISGALKDVTPEQFWLAWSTSSYLADAASLLYAALYLGESIPDDVIEQSTQSVIDILTEAGKMNVARGTFWV